MFAIITGLRLRSPCARRTDGHSASPAKRFAGQSIGQEIPFSERGADIGKCHYLVFTSARQPLDRFHFLGALEIGNFMIARKNLKNA